MEQGNRQEALVRLLNIAAVKGYVTFDDIFDCSNEFGLSFGAFDWLSENIATRSIIIYDEDPSSLDSDNSDYDDYAQIDYEETFQRVIEVEPNLEALIEEIRNTKPPQRGEVGQLKYQVKEGNEHARQRMIEMYMRIAVRIALQRSMDYDTDLEATLGDAFVGLIIAVDKYDPDHSGPFVSYASMWIYQNITREQRPQNTNLYFPAHRKELYYSSYPLLKRRGCTECECLSECKKAREMVQAKIDGNEDQVEDVITASLPALPLHQIAKEIRRSDYIYETTGEKIISIAERSLCCSDEDVIKYASATLQRERLMDLLDELPERTELILRARWGLDDGQERTLEEVGQMFNLTRERIRQIEAKALRKLQNRMKPPKKRGPKPKSEKEKQPEETAEKTEPMQDGHAISEATQRVLNSWKALEDYNKKRGVEINSPMQPKKRGRPPKKRTI